MSSPRIKKSNLLSELKVTPNKFENIKERSRGARPFKIKTERGSRIRDLTPCRTKMIMLLSSAEMNESDMLSKIVTFLFSKIILGVGQFFSLIGLSILLQKSLYIVSDT